MEISPKLRLALQESKRITHASGTSYFIASRFLEKEQQQAIYALYGFVRRADDTVDIAEEGSTAEERLGRFEHAWHEAYTTKDSEDLVLYAAQWVVHQYAIPLEEINAFLSAMRRDLTQDRYQTYADLEEYMYGSAVVIGRMLTRIFGYNSEQAFPFAEDLGTAMQITNFLRDMNEDYVLRGRIYIPADDMGLFGVTEEAIALGKVTEEIRNLFKFQIDRARMLYARSDQGIRFLSPESRKAVTLARIFYSKILDAIEAADYDVFSARRRVSTITKARYAIPVLFT